MRAHLPMLLLLLAFSQVSYWSGWWLGRRQGYDEANAWHARIGRMAAMLEISHGNGRTTVE